MEIKEIIAKQLKISVDELKDDTQIKYELGIDSLDIMVIISEIENKYKISIDVNELKEDSTVLDIINLVNSKIK